jgi:adenylate cyclase
MADVERLLKDREKADAALASAMKTVVFMFTDIKGSTAFYENRGDIEGLAMVNRHNGLLFPLITENRGKVVKTVGDAIMASFDQGSDAIRAAIAMQQALRKDSEGKPAGN